MEKEMKDLVEQLGTAIDEAIAESERIAGIVHEMEREGYDLTLVLEATMRLSPKDKSSEETWSEPVPTPVLASTGRFDLTPQDQEFLQALKVAI